jgi:prepilin-type N-terminal cleavage/methylation domain-containing protein
MMTPRLPEQHATKGFTLIELSIVLVIIGLVLGGIMVGRELIRAAELRSVISQIEKYKTAITTFKLKYNALPGDIQATEAAAFGFATRTGAAGHGDGNGLVQSCTTGVIFDNFAGCENLLFWRDLADARLISGDFSTASDALGANLTQAQTSLYFPEAKLGRGNRLIALYFNSATVMYPHGNILAISPVNSTNATGDFTLSPERITVYENFIIDSKIDDGYGYTGKVITHSGASFNTFSNLCANVVAPYQYYIDTWPNNLNCHVLFYW